MDNLVNMNFEDISKRLLNLLRLQRKSPLILSNLNNHKHRQRKREQQKIYQQQSQQTTQRIQSSGETLKQIPKFNDRVGKERATYRQE